MMQYTYFKPDPEATHCWHITDNEMEALILKHISEQYGPIPEGKVYVMYPSYPCDNDGIKVRIQSVDVVL